MGKLYRIQKMLQNFEHLKAIITVAEIPFVLVNAMKWQNDLKLRIKVKGKGRPQTTVPGYCREIIPGNYPGVVECGRNVNNALWTVHFTKQPPLGFGKFAPTNAQPFILSP